MSHRYTCCIRSLPETTLKVLFVDDPLRDERALGAVSAGRRPRVLPSSWFISSVNVPSPLSNAPRPSGMPTMR